MKILIGLILFILSLFYQPEGEFKISFLNFVLPAITALAGGLSNRGPGGDVKNLQKQLLAQQMQLFQGADLTGYEASQMDEINQLSDIERRNLLETLAARGVSGPAVGFAEAGLDRNRFSALTKLKQSIPLLAQSLRAGAVGTGTNLFNSLAPQQGNVAGGVASGFANTLAYLYGQGAFGQNQSDASKIGGNIVKGATSLPRG